MKSLEDAKRDAIADGYNGDPTPEVLRLYGWEPSDRAEHVLALALEQPARTKQQVQDDCKLLIEEAEANQIAPQVMNIIMKVVGSAAKLAVCFMFLILLGCESIDHVDYKNDPVNKNLTEADKIILNQYEKQEEVTWIESKEFDQYKYGELYVNGKLVRSGPKKDGSSFWNK